MIELNRENEMDKRKLLLILLGVVGAIILIVGIGAARIYTKLGFWESQYKFNSGGVFSLADVRAMGTQMQNEEFADWILKWVVKPFSLFLVLTAAIVASQIIWKRVISNPEEKECAQIE